MFLDPTDNEKRHQRRGNETTGLDIGVLIRELNTGSIRYMGCALAAPQYGANNEEGLR